MQNGKLCGQFISGMGAHAVQAATRHHRHPSLTLAQVISRFERSYRASGPGLSQMQDRALRELRICRTAELGGHVDRCDRCGHEQAGYNSCRNRHCNQCCGGLRARWYEQREAEMLPVEYQHVVFTLPGRISQLAADNGPLLYGLLFELASKVLLRYGRDHYGIQFGLICVLHTWGQTMNFHVHVHILLPSGGLSLDGRRWISLPSGFALPREELMVIFRKRFVSRLNRYYREGKLTLSGSFACLKHAHLFAAWLKQLKSQRWVVHTEAANRRGPSGKKADAGQALKYLARYASGVAISNKRLLSISDRHVTFSYKDYRHGGKRRLMTLPGTQFLERFLQHVLPRQFRHIRNFGFLSAGKRGQALPLIHRLLGLQEQAQDAGADNDASQETAGDADESDKSRLCPQCRQGKMGRVADIPRPTIAQIMWMPFPWEPRQRYLRFDWSLDIPQLENT